MKDADEQPIATSYQRSIGLQSVLFFMLCKIAGRTKWEAIEDFLYSQIAMRYSVITVQQVCALAELAGYDKQ